jgi:hypothetical protein
MSPIETSSPGCPCTGESESRKPILGSLAGHRYLTSMRTLILDPPTAGLEELLARRRRSGLDRLDEVWQGVLHMVPAPREAHARITQQPLSCSVRLRAPPD